MKYQSREWCLLTESESAQLIGINNTRGLNGPDCPNRSEHDLLLKLKKIFLRFKRILFKLLHFNQARDFLENINLRKLYPEIYP